MRVLKKQLGAEVHFLTKQSFATLVVPNPYIDRVWTIEKEVGEVRAQLQQEGFTAVVDLHHNLRTWQLRWALRGIPFYRFDKLNWKKWLLVNWKINRMPPVHIVGRYLAAAAPLGVSYDGLGLDYFIPPAEEIDLPTWAETLTEVAAPWRERVAQGDYIAFVVGAAHQTKRLPTEQIITIGRQFLQPVILLGGPGEAEEGARIRREVGEQIINACGKLRLHQSASIVRQAQAVISHDTGLMHMAAAFRKPIVSIWGNTVPAFGMDPFYPDGLNRNSSVEVKGLSCRPCSKIGYAECPKGHFRCMRDIPPTAVATALEQVKNRL